MKKDAWEINLNEERDVFVMKKKKKETYIYIYKYCIYTPLQLCFGFLSNNCAASHQMHSLMTALDPSRPCPASQKQPHTHC